MLPSASRRSKAFFALTDDAVTTPTNSAFPADVMVPPAPEAPISIPSLAVTTPTESILVTSS